MISAAAISRRAVLGLGIVAVAGCKHTPSRRTPRVDPDATALAAARAVEIELVAAITDPAARAIHLQHLTALGGTLPTAAPHPVTEATRRLLRGSAASLRAAAIAAVDGAHAALFASIAAAHEVALDD